MLLSASEAAEKNLSTGGNWRNKIAWPSADYSALTSLWRVF